MVELAGPSIADVAGGAYGARKDWLPYLERLIQARVVMDREGGMGGLQWAPLSRLFARVFAKKARGARDRHRRDGKPFRPLMWREGKGGFCEAKAFDVARHGAEPDAFSLFDLCEYCYWLDGKDSSRRGRREGLKLLEACIGCVNGVFGRKVPGREPPICGVDMDELVFLVGAALRQGAERLDRHWSDLWTNAGARMSLEDTEKAVDTTMRELLELRLGKQFSWIARSSSRPSPTTHELVFIVEPVSGRRNLRSGVPIYCVALAAARCVSTDPLRLAPICAGIHVPHAGHMYIGALAPFRGAVLIDERLADVHALVQSHRRGSDLTVGIHHSRRLPRLSRAFVDEISKLLPATVDKELALGSGALHLALTASGGLAAFFDPAIRGCSAYPGAILLCAATGRNDAATDLAGRSWLEGDPLTTEGILAWNDPALRKQIERKLLQFSGSFLPGESSATRRTS